MTNLIFVGIALRLQHETDPAKAEALLQNLSDPFTRALVRQQWAKLRAAEVTTLETSA